MRKPDPPLETYYAARAREYERIYAKPERQADLRQVEHMLPTFFAGRRVLEIACGTGYWTPFLARRARGVVAVDVNPETLEVASEKPLPPKRVRFCVADAHDLSEELGSFDAAFAGFWWSHILLQDRGRFLGSLDGRLLAGAKVLFLDNFFVEGSSTPIDRRDPEGNTYQRRRLDDGSEHVVLKNFPSEAELRADIAPFGHNLQFTALQYYWLLSYEKRDHAGSWSPGYSSGSEGKNDSPRTNTEPGPSTSPPGRHPTPTS
jgi:demethylmenaquinone methyltransferase/2-methoxy-6-polyprenyl-1,4-benzoquinol methylase